MTLSENLRRYLEADNEKIDILIAENPINLSIQDISAFTGMDVASVRAAIENNVFGASWRKAGSTRHGYYIPTGQFVRWYLRM